MTTPVMDINECRKRILAGETIPPEILRAHIEALSAKRLEQVVKKEEKRVKKGNLSPEEQNKSLSIFDDL